MRVTLSHQFNQIKISLYNRPRQNGYSKKCGRPVRARCSMRIGPVPTNKWFKSAYLQIKYLIPRKIHSNTFWLEKLFPVDHKSPWCLRNKRLKKKKWEWDFQLGTPLPSPPSKKNKYPLKNHWGCTLAEVRSWPRKWCNNYFSKTFFFKIPDLVQRHTSAPVAAGNRR